MNKLHALTFYALVTPAMTLGAGSVLAEKSADQDMEYEQQSAQHDQDVKHTDSGSHSALENSQRDQDQQSISDQGKQRAKNSGSHPAESAQHDQDVKHTDSGSHPAVENSQRGKNQQSISDQGKQRAKNSGPHPAAENSQRDKAHAKNRDYTDSAAANGMKASGLIGTKVSTSNDEKVGSVRDLIIDEDGQVVAIVVGVGGFLGLGEKDVAIGWDDITRSETADGQELRIDMTREELRAAPLFEMQM